jgi:hypothetical protein
MSLYIRLLRYFLVFFRVADNSNPARQVLNRTRFGNIGI